jgi:hypothetical protein
MKRRVITEKLVVGGLHKDDFEWASVEYEEAGFLVCFELDVDGYHWRAVYVKAGTLEKLLGEGGPLRPSLSVSMHLLRGIKSHEPFHF